MRCSGIFTSFPEFQSKREPASLAGSFFFDIDMQVSHHAYIPHIAN